MGERRWTGASGGHSLFSISTDHPMTDTAPLTAHEIRAKLRTKIDQDVAFEMRDHAVATLRRSGRSVPAATEDVLRDLEGLATALDGVRPAAPSAPAGRVPAHSGDGDAALLAQYEKLADPKERAAFIAENEARLRRLLQDAAFTPQPERVATVPEALAQDGDQALAAAYEKARAAGGSTLTRFIAFNERALRSLLARAA